MKSIEILIKEHENIRRMLNVIKIVCINIVNGKEIDDSEINVIIDFIKNYADKYHHGKEEKFLFPAMVKHLGKTAENIVTHGMMVEHIIGRGHISNLKQSLKRYVDNKNDIDKLDIITSLNGYAMLLNNHIDKENDVVYTFAEKNLSQEVKEMIDEKSLNFENLEDSKNIRSKYLAILDSLEKKYVLV